MISRQTLSKALVISTWTIIFLQLLLFLTLWTPSDKTKETLVATWDTLEFVQKALSALLVVQFTERGIHNLKKYREKQKQDAIAKKEFNHMSSCKYHLPNQAYLKCAVNPSEPCLTCSSYEPQKSEKIK